MGAEFGGSGGMPGRRNDADGRGGGPEPLLSVEYVGAWERLPLWEEDQVRDIPLVSLVYVGGMLLLLLLLSYEYASGNVVAAAPLREAVRDIPLCTLE